MHHYQHAKNQANPSIYSGDIVDLKILQSDWLRVFCSISLEQDFCQIYDLCRFYAVHISIFIIVQIQWQWPNFSINSKNPVLGSFSTLFRKFSKFPKTFGSATHNSWGFLSTCHNLEKNLMILWRKAWQIIFYRTLAPMIGNPKLV